MKRAAIISAILDNPQVSQRGFNDIVSEHNDIVRGRMGIPFGQGKIALVSLTVVAELDRLDWSAWKVGGCYCESFYCKGRHCAGMKKLD